MRIDVSVCPGAGVASVAADRRVKSRIIGRGGLDIAESSRWFLAPAQPFWFQPLDIETGLAPPTCQTEFENRVARCFHGQSAQIDPLVQTDLEESVSSTHYRGP